MIQSKIRPTWEKKEPWRFVPRRDLFPDAELPPQYTKSLKSDDRRKQPEKKYNTPVHQIQNKTTVPVTYKSRQDGKRSNQLPLPENHPLTPVHTKGQQTGGGFAFQPELLLLLFAGWFLLGSRSKGLGLEGLGVFNQPQSIEMLKSIGPYLNANEQKIAYTAAGIMEAIQLIKNVMNHTYHNQNQATLMQIPSNPAQRKIEALKAIKPYIHMNNRKQLDRVLNFYESTNKVQRNIALYQNNRALASDQRQSPIESAGEFLKVIRPILPQEQKEKADKAVQVMKMIDVMASADKLTRDEKKEKKKDQAKPRDREVQADQEKKYAQNDQMQTIMDSIAPMLNEEQKGSMDMIMKMAQLLSQPEQVQQDHNGE